jgi:hypothetical protein
MMRLGFMGRGGQMLSSHIRAARTTRYRSTPCPCLNNRNLLFVSTLYRTSNASCS